MKYNSSRHQNRNKQKTEASEYLEKHYVPGNYRSLNNYSVPDSKQESYRV